MTLCSCVCNVVTSPGQVTTGGVSMGDRDLLRQVLVEQFGARIHFARVNMKPGKPTTFATCTVAGRRVLLGARTQLSPLVLCSAPSVPQPRHLLALSHLRHY